MSAPDEYWRGVLARIEDRIMIDDDTGCWLWLARSSRNGYGRISVCGVERQAHRVLWSLLFGPLPDRTVLDHLCRNRHCINPAHLEPVSIRENTLRGDGPTARRYRAAQAAKGS